MTKPTTQVNAAYYQVESRITEEVNYLFDDNSAPELIETLTELLRVWTLRPELLLGEIDNRNLFYQALLLIEFISKLQQHHLTLNKVVVSEGLLEDDQQPQSENGHD